MSDSPAYSSFELPPMATFETGPGGLVWLKIETQLSSARLSLHGAHVTHFQPAGAAPVLFLSAASVFAPGKPIRGGVPICFPWFGPRAGHPAAPGHGFARTAGWEVEALAGSAAEGVTVLLRLVSNAATRALWPYDFILRYRLVFTQELEMTLEVQNTSATPFEFEEALHTYLAISDVANVTVTGLENTSYLDKTDALRKKQEGTEPIQIRAETDRVYLDTTSTAQIHDPGLARSLEIAKRGSDTTVLWNPWIAKAAAMADFGDTEWPQMLCLETANAGPQTITLAPAARHALTATLRLR